MKRPTVVMLGTFGLRPKGTMSARALPIGQTLAARGWRVRLILSPWDWPADAGRREALGGVKVVNVALGGGPVAVAARMVREARAERPALVHLFKPKGYAGVAAHALRLAGWPLVVDNDDWEGPGGWNDRVPTYTPTQRLLFAWQAWALPRAADGLTVASRALVNQAAALGVAPGRVHYLPNALTEARHGPWFAPPDPARRAADRAALGLDDAPTLVLYTRFDVVTPARTVALLAAVRHRLPDTRLLVVGSGLHGEDATLWDMARSAGLAGALYPAGFVPFERLPDLLRLADVALYPIDDSLINRAKAPFKLLELMALGLPVAAEAVGETAAYIEDGRSGRLVAAGATEALAATAADLLANPATRARLGAAARARVRACYNWATLIGGVEAAYAQATHPV